MQGTTKANGQKHALDKFYTKPEIAKACLDSLDLPSYALCIEPSAGGGSFSSLLPSGSIALDLAPEHPKIIEQDFFNYEPPQVDGKILVVGNPPFGQQNSLAIRFINHAAKFADVIAFVIPRSFEKASVQKRIHKNLHLISSTTLPVKAFTLHGEDYAVPCVFQIWEKRDAIREIQESKLTTTHFSFVKKTDAPHFSIRRVGGNAGKASLNTDVSDQSNYFISCPASETSPSPQEMVAFINTLTFPTRDLGVGPRTISKGELIEVFESAHENRA